VITREQATVRIVHTRPEHGEALEKIQHLVYPTLTDDELYTAKKYRKHIEIFPQGQFVALVTYEGRAPLVAGSTVTFRTNFDFDHPDHTYLDAVGGGWLTNHTPDGEWLYGGDLNVHPDFHGRGIGGRLYHARQKLVERLGLRGEIAGAMLPGYHKYRSQMSIEAWLQQVIDGKIQTLPLSMQLKNGFKVRAILRDHITDPRCDNCAALIVRENPNYRRRRH
jgi:GNAT superfamily N-acetyltransferase